MALHIEPGIAISQAMLLTRRILGRSRNPPAPASGTRGSRAAPPGTAALGVQWPQPLGHHLEELCLLPVAGIPADPAERAARETRGWNRDTA